MAMPHQISGAMEDCYPDYRVEERKVGLEKREMVALQGYILHAHQNSQALPL